MCLYINIHPTVHIMHHCHVCPASDASAPSRCAHHRLSHSVAGALASDLNRNFW